MADNSRYSEAQNKATQKYIHKSYDQISIRVRKDGDITRESIQKAADRAGLSLNAYIMEAVKEKMNGLAPDPVKEVIPETKYY